MGVRNVSGRGHIGKMGHMRQPVAQSASTVVYNTGPNMIYVNPTGYSKTRQDICRQDMINADQAEHMQTRQDTRSPNRIHENQTSYLQTR